MIYKTEIEEKELTALTINLTHNEDLDLLRASLIKVCMFALESELAREDVNYVMSTILTSMSQSIEKDIYKTTILKNEE